MIRIGNVMKTLICACFCLLLAGCTRETGYAPVSSGEVNVILSLGTRAPLTPGRSVPVTVRATGDYALADNTVTLTVPTGSGDYYCYRSPFQLRQDGSGEAVFTVTVSDGSSQMAAEILNADGNVIYSRICSYRFSETGSFARETVVAAFAPLLDSSVWDASFTQGSELIHIRTVTADAQFVRSDPSLLSGFDILVLGPEADSLSPEARSGIFAWQAEGGCLLFTGGRESAVRFGEDILSETATYRFSGTLTVTGYQAETGNLWVMERAQFLALQNTESVISLVEIIRKETAARRESAERLLNFEKRYAEQLEEVTVADGRPFFIILTLYVVVLLPGGYLLLRRLDRMHLFRILAVATALAVSGIVWLAGSGTRFSEPFLQRVTQLSFENGVFEECSLVNVQAPYSRAFALSIRPEYRVEAVQDGSPWQGGNYSVYDGTAVELIPGSADTTLSLENIPAFSPRKFLLKRRLEGPGEPLELLGEGEGLRLKNTSPYLLKDVLIAAGDSLSYVAEWKPGEAVTAVADTKEGPASGFPEELADNLYEEAYRNFLEETIPGIGVYARMEETFTVQEGTSLPEQELCFLKVLMEE